MGDDLIYLIFGVVGISFSIMLPILVFQHIENRKIKGELTNTNRMLNELISNSNHHEAKYKSINAQLGIIGSKVAPESYKKLHRIKATPTPSMKNDPTINQGNPTLLQ
jgi:hypothetical protein